MTDAPSPARRLAGAVVRLALGVAVTLYAVRSPDWPWSMPLLAVWALLLPGPLLDGLASAWGALRTSAGAERGFRVLQRGGDRVRLREVDGALWLVDRDLFALLGARPDDATLRSLDATEHDRLPGTRLRGFSEQGVRKLLRLVRHGESRAIEQWLEREAFGPHRRRRAHDRLSARRTAP